MSDTRNARRPRQLTRLLLLAAVLLLAVLTGAQIFAHRNPYFTPNYPMEDLSPLLEKTALTGADYHALLLQTGMGAPAVDDLLAMGEAGRAQLLAAQTAFFRPPKISCDNLGFVTREDHQTDASDNLIYGFPMAPLENGDVLLSFSTHTMGWRHGHAGLVVDAANGHTLEAVLIGTDSTLSDARHWQLYANFLHLRLKDITPDQQAEIASFALSRMEGIPYRLLSGLLGDKYPDPETGDLGAQCAYLVWYTLMQAGYDTDGDGGRLVTVADLATSPLFEVVQVYGIDPRQFPTPQ